MRSDHQERGIRPCTAVYTYVRKRSYDGVPTKFSRYRGRVRTYQLTVPARVRTYGRTHMDTHSYRTQLVLPRLLNLSISKFRFIVFFDFVDQVLNLVFYFEKSPE
eukprot:SAG31_NODE_2666_length_5273_cov_2.404716_8_plen_105_part_00